MPTLSGGALKAERLSMVATPEQIANAAWQLGYLTLAEARAYIKNRDIPQVVIDTLNADQALSNFERDQTLLALEGATQVRRTAPLFGYLQSAFGTTDEDTDALMRLALTL